jgi:TP53 regulating kinase and related kinases
MESQQPPDSVAGAYPLPKVLEYPASSPPTLITQGAEGRLYKTTYLLPDIPCALKYRPSKPYRHPILDQRLTRHRILSEARILAKCQREGIVVPAVYAINETAGWLMLEWIQGEPVRAKINEWLALKAGTNIEEDAQLKGLMRRVGAAVAKLHRISVIHGDLTTSNMMLRPWPEEAANGHLEAKESVLDGEVVIIDFGLASQNASVQDEDRAVDLYVLERAFGSTHPKAECAFSELLEAYAEAYKQGSAVLKKLEDVRLRGRKRTMIG